MNKLFDENGSPTEQLSKTLTEFLGKEIDTLLNSAQNTSDLQTMQTIILKFISDKFADAKSVIINQPVVLINQFSDMSDDDFELYMANKYGNNWLLKSITADEMSRSGSIIKKRVEKLSEKIKSEQSGYTVPRTSVYPYCPWWKSTWYK